MREPRATRVFDGDADFDTRLLPGLRSMRLFRAPSDEEIDASFAAYERGDFAALCDAWCAVAQPARCALDGVFGAIYRLGPLSPTRVSAALFVSTLRAVLAAGVRFRARLSPRVRAAIETEFPWLEGRHPHIPPGWTPDFDFPRTFDAFVDVSDLDDARVRWQLTTALNEVQQSHFSATCARQWRLPELVAHAAYERRLAIDYFAHGAPRVTRELWRQSLAILDGLNAAVMQMIVYDQRGAMLRNALRGESVRIVAPRA